MKNLFRTIFVFCCLSIDTSGWTATAAFDINNDVGQCYTKWKDEIIEQNNVNWAKTEKFKPSVDNVLRDIMAQCFEKKDKFANDRIIDYTESGYNPATFTGANWNYILMANFKKFSVWGSQRYANEGQTGLEKVLFNLYGANYATSFYNPSDYYAQTSDKKLIWLRNDEKGIDLMGQILQKHYETHYSGKIANLADKIERAVSDCKIYASQLGLFDCMNEIKLHEVAKNLVGTTTTYRLKDLVRDREALMYTLEKSQTTFCKYSVKHTKYIEAGTQDNPQNFVVCGDLHGDFNSLSAVLNKYAPEVADGKKSLVFLGDYIDRGPHSLEVFTALLTLKHAFPERILMLAGNHESEEYNWATGYYSSIIKLANQTNFDKSSDDAENGIATSLKNLGLSDPLADWPDTGTHTVSSEIYNKLFETFHFLPILMRLNGSMLCVHAALPIPLLDSKEELDEFKISTFNITDITNWAGTGIRVQMQWNDVVKELDYSMYSNDQRPTQYKNGRGIGYQVPVEIIHKLLGANKAKILIKAHQHRAPFNAFGQDIYNIITMRFFDLRLLNDYASILEIVGNKIERKAVKELVESNARDKYMTDKLGEESLKEWNAYVVQYSSPCQIV